MPVIDAQARLLSGLKTLPPERVALQLAEGRILAEDVMAGFDLPPFTNSGMDGFAVRAEDVAGAGVDAVARLRVVGDIPAGQSANLAVGPGEAMRIMTGAPLPHGADAVAPLELTDFRRPAPGEPAPLEVGILQAVEAGNAVRSRGQDVRAGQLILPTGRVLRAQEIGLLAAVGWGEAPVWAKPRLGVLSTGDELVAPGRTLGPGQIYDSNRSMLTALARAAGAEVVFEASVPDQPGPIAEALDAALAAGANLLVSSAGVSVGAFDYVRQVVQSAGKLDFWRVNMRPGKPLAFGYYRGLPIIGLPGNPVSAFVGFYVFVRPAIWKMGGRKLQHDGRMRVRLAEAIESDGRESYLRATLWRSPAGETWARLSGHQGSANLYALTCANAFIIVPSEVKSLPFGADVEAWLLAAENELEIAAAPVED